MLIKKAEAKKLDNSESCTVWNYSFPSENLSYATALIDGRYPDQNRVTNLECEEVYYVISGSGIIHSEKGDFKLSEGDAYFFEKGEVYWVEGKKLFLALVNAPKFSPEQHKIVE